VLGDETSWQPIDMASESRPVSRSRSILVKWMGIGDANSAGFVHGGTVLYLCDEAGGLAGVRHSSGRVVTAGLDRMTFLLPVHVGELLSLESSVNAAWRTSMEVGVRVTAENPRTGERRHTATAYLTMVGVDDDGRPRPVPALVSETEDEHRREREAQLRRANRLAEREEILAARSRPGGAS
jgi:acyl-CoA hydrolase